MSGSRFDTAYPSIGYGVNGRNLTRARIRRIFLDGYDVLVFRIVIFKISSFKLQNARLLLTTVAIPFDVGNFIIECIVEATAPKLPIPVLPSRALYGDGLLTTANSIMTVRWYSRFFQPQPRLVIEIPKAMLIHDFRRATAINIYPSNPEALNHGINYYWTIH
ncbi:hypothetical protein Tco_0214740 [Tanacetum coccineum]